MPEMAWSFEGANAVDDTITPLARVVHATVRRVTPQGTIRYLYPIYDRATAERAMFLLPLARPPLSLDERWAVVQRAKHYLTTLPGPLA